MCNGIKRIVQKCTAELGMEPVPLHASEMGITIQYHVMLICQPSNQILMWCNIILYLPGLTFATFSPSVDQ